MKLEWRTRNVLALCQAMRETHDYSEACPILADALEDAGCDDTSLLTGLRTLQDPQALLRLVALVYSEETAEAVARIEQLAEAIGPRAFCEEGDDYGAKQPTTFERLMRVGDRWTLLDEDGYGDFTVEHGDEELRNESWLIEGLWEPYAVLTGRQGSGNPFSCSC